MNNVTSHLNSMARYITDVQKLVGILSHGVMINEETAIGTIVLNVVVSISNYFIIL